MAEVVLVVPAVPALGSVPRSALSDERRLLTVDMGDDDEEEGATPADAAGVPRTAEPIPVPPLDLTLAAEDGRADAEEPTRLPSGRGGASPARVAWLCPAASVTDADGADAEGPPVEAASRRRLRAARASWADCFRAAEAEEVVSDATMVPLPLQKQILPVVNMSRGNI